MLELTEDKLRELDATGWELYNVEVDPAETEQPRRARTREAHRDDRALVHGGRQVQRAATRQPRHDALRRRASADRRRTRQSTSTFPRTQAVPENVAAKVLNRAHTITVDAETPKAGEEGVLACHGSNVGGYALFVQDGKLHYVHNYVGAEEFRVSVGATGAARKALHCATNSNRPARPTSRTARARRARASSSSTANSSAQADFPVTVPLALGLGSGFAVGRNPGSSVSEMYASPFAVHRHDHQGDRRRVRQSPDNDEDAMKNAKRVAMARQ